MREAVIVSTARTPMTKSHRGEFNVTPAAQLAAFSVRAAVERSGVDPAMIEDLILGCGNPDGFQGRNLGRQAVLRHEERTRAPDPVRLRASVAPCFNDRFALRIHAIVNEVLSERSMPRTTADAP